MIFSENESNVVAATLYEWGRMLILCNVPEDLTLKIYDKVNDLIESQSMKDGIKCDHFPYFYEFDGDNDKLNRMCNPYVFINFEKEN